jgi:hypothetical protein
VALLCAAVTMAMAAPGATAAKKPASAAATGVSLSVKGKPRLLGKVTVNGHVANSLAGEQVEVAVTAQGRELFKKKVHAKSDGSFDLGIQINSCCRYVIEATAASGPKGSTSFKVGVPRKLGKGALTRLFNRSLQRAGYHTGTKGRKVTLGTRLAIKAFRKTNGMGRSQKYRRGIFRKLLQGRGGFNPRYTDGRHVEVDLSRQVMSLIQGDTPKHTFHVSSGTSSTPTIRGKYTFYRKEPGYNNVRMYFSVYFQGGYAIHGYSGVPNYPASHGCVRNPIPFSRFIYNWVDVGMPIYVYT